MKISFDHFNIKTSLLKLHEFLSLHDYFQHQNRNARLIRTVLTTLHVYKRNVKIHVIQTLAVKMPNVKPKTIGPFVFAFQDILEIHIHFVKNVRFLELNSNGGRNIMKIHSSNCGYS